MASLLSEHLKTADWKTEKHVPVIDCPDTFKKDEFTRVTVTLGKAIAHPNTTEHHIRWIALFFKPEGGNDYEIAHFGFQAHGESTNGPNMGPVYTHHEGSALMKTAVGGTLMAEAYCNIHGLWQASKDIELAP